MLLLFVLLPGGRLGEPEQGQRATEHGGQGTAAGTGEGQFAGEGIEALQIHGDLR
jgi:hypothetical protein